jgi:UDPglucose 6-dehydrogenase
MKSETCSAAVVGAGYVGAVTAVGLAGLGHRVLLVERDDRRLASLRAGRAPIHEPGLDDGIRTALQRGRLAFASRLTECATGVVFICVGTPIDEAGESDLGQVVDALEEVRTLPDEATVVIRSTLPIGASRALAESGLVDTRRTFTNPEFLRQGTALADFLHPSRIVVGRYPDADERRLTDLLALFDALPGPRFIVDVVEAELIKNGANAFLALRLSFVNELAVLAEEYGGEIEQVLSAIAADPRVGSAYMRPSFGFGGSCLPKELKTLAAAGRARGLPMHVTAAASAANGAHMARFAARIERLLGGLDGQRIGLLGLAYKAGTDDVRASPALWLARTLLTKGAAVRAYDPLAGRHAVEAVPALAVASSIDEALDGADVAVVATEWPDFKAYDWSRATRLLRRPLVIDGRRILDGDAIRAAGLRFYAFGSPDDRLRTGRTAPSSQSISLASR